MKIVVYFVSRLSGPSGEYIFLLLHVELVDDVLVFIFSF